MAQYVMNAYDADVYIPMFKGLMQYGDQMGNDLRYSPDCMNVETPAGVLQPVTKLEGAILCGIDSDANYKVMGARTGAMMYVRLNNRVIDSSQQGSDLSGSGSGSGSYDDSAVIVPLEPGASYEESGATHAASKGGVDDLALADKTPYDLFLVYNGNAPFSLVAIEDLKESGWYYLWNAGNAESTSIDRRWSWVTYEETDDDRTSNILLVANEKTYVYKWSDFGMITVNTPKKFRYIARYAERIWGIAGDTLYYSRPFDASDWTQDNADPANGGGEIRQPTFDDDKIVAMKTLGDALIIFSKKRAWRLTGSDPSSFVLQEQIGNGTQYPETIAEVGGRIIMLGDEGLLVYDGYHVTPLMQEATHEIFRNIFIGRNGTRPIAVRMGNKYVLALNTEIGSQPVFSYGVSDTGTVSPEVSKNIGQGYRTLVYDTQDGTITQMNTPEIVSFCEGTPYFIAHFEGEAPGKPDYVSYDDPLNPSYNKIMRMRFDSWNEKRPTTAATRWVSPWVTFGRNDIKKGGFDLYFTPEIAPKKERVRQLWEGNTGGTSGLTNPERPSIFETEETEPEETSVTFKISIQTEKKTKTKYYTVNALTEEAVAAGKEYKAKKLHFGGAGRRFRVIIETEAVDESIKPAVPWRLIGGVHIIAETDKD